MNLNIAGMAAGYRGYADEAQRIADEDRRVKAEQRAEKDAAYQEEARQRQRTEWSEQDRIKAADKADLAEVNARYASEAAAGNDAADLAIAKQQVKDGQTQAQIDAALAPPEDPTVAAVSKVPTDSVVVGDTPSWAKTGGIKAEKADSPVLDPAVAAKLQELAPPVGMPKPRNFNDALAKQSDLLRMKADRGDLKLADYAQGMQLINTMKTEGVNDALKRFSAGDYQGGIDAFNQTGAHRGAKIIKGVEGVTKINGEDVPTHYITIANADGSQTVIDSARAQYQLMDLNSQLTHVDRARQTEMMGKHYAETAANQKLQIQQSAADAAASRGLQSQQLALQRQQFEATTPMGRIKALSEALGKAPTSDQIENMLGVSKIPRAIELQVQSLIKENDTDSQAMARAIASPEGINPAAAATFQKNAALRNEKLSKLLQPYSAGGNATPSDPAGILNKPAGTAPGAMPPAGAATPAAGNQGSAVVPQPGGVRAVLSPGAAARLRSDIPSPPAQKVWIGNAYTTNPAYERWYRDYGQAYNQRITDSAASSTQENLDATNRLNRARPY